MVKRSEPALTDRNSARAKETVRLGPKGEVVGRGGERHPLAISSATRSIAGT